MRQSSTESAPRPDMPAPGSRLLAEVFSQRRDSPGWRRAVWRGLPCQRPMSSAVPQRRRPRAWTVVARRPDTRALRRRAMPTVRIAPRRVPLIGDGSATTVQSPRPPLWGTAAGHRPLTLQSSDRRATPVGSRWLQHLGQQARQGGHVRGGIDSVLESAHVYLRSGIGCLLGLEWVVDERCLHGSGAAACETGVDHARHRFTGGAPFASVTGAGRPYPDGQGALSRRHRGLGQSRQNWF